MTYPHIHTLHPYCKKKCTCILRAALDIFFFPYIPYILQISMAPMARKSCPWTSGCNWLSWSSPCLAAMRPKLCDWTRSGLGMVPWCPKCHPQLDFYSFSMMINDVPLPCWIQNDWTDWTSLSFPVPNPNATSPNQYLYSWRLRISIQESVRRENPWGKRHWYTRHYQARVAPTH